MLSGDTMDKTDDGLAIMFASSIIGHHVLALGLIENGALVDSARAVLAGSEVANNDLPGMMDMKVYDFVTGPPSEFGSTLKEAMTNSARGATPGPFRSTCRYATVKAFTAWWAGAMALRFGQRFSFFAVSPGSNMGTNAARHETGFKKFLFTKVMPILGPTIGVDQPVSLAAKRYLDVLHGASDEYLDGGTYTSKPGKLVGHVQRMTHAHLIDGERQEATWQVLGELTGTTHEA